MDEECGPLHDGSSSSSYQLGQSLELSSDIATWSTLG